MTRTIITRENPSGELEALRHRVEELEVLEVKYRVNKSLFQLENEARYEAVFKSANDALLLIDKQGKIIDVNQRLIEVSGHTREMLVGKPVTALSKMVSQEKSAICLLTILKTMTITNVPPFEFKLSKNNGEQLAIEISSRPLRKGDKPIGDLVILRDVTDRKRIEEARNLSEHNFRNSLDKAFIGIRISDNNDNTSYVNQAFFDIFGYKNIDEVNAHPPPEFYTPEAHASWALRHKRFLHGETMPKQVDIDIARIDGSIGHLEVSMAEIFWDGRRQYQTFYSDITKRQETEEALKASESKYSTLIEQSTDGIVILNVHSIEFANRKICDISGYSQSEILGKHFDNLISPESLKTLENSYQRKLSPATANTLEMELLTKDGRNIPIETSAHPIMYKERAATMVIIRDISERKRAEEALHESEEKYRLIVENSSDIIFTLDAEGNVLYVSSSVKNMLGYNPEDLKGHPFAELVHPEDIKGVQESIQRTILDGQQTSGGIEYRVRNSSGVWRWHNGTGNIVRDVNGKFLNFLCLSRDISERKKLEQTLYESEEKFREYTNKSPLAIFVTDANGKYIEVNPAACEMSGYSNEELLHMSILEFLAPEGRVPGLKAFQQAAAAGYFEGELLCQRKNWSIFWIFLVSVRLQGDKFMAICRDITEQRRAEDKLKHAAQEWRTTFDAITDLISIHDKDNRIVRVNKAVADLLKTTPHELIGKFCHEIMHGTKEPPPYCPNLETLKTGKPAVMETFNPDFDAYFHESTSPLFNEKGEVIGSVNVARDITQEKRIQEQLIMTDRLASIGELSSGIAHELNNPLTSVIGFSQLLMDGDVPADMKEELGIVYSEAQRAAVIVKNLLTFARKHAPVKQLSQVNTVVEDVLRLRAYEQKVNNIEVEQHLAPNLPEIMMDHFQMQQVFLNIIVNAEAAMLEKHHKGKLIITTEKSEGMLTVTFTDDGPGIPRENLKRIFDPFFTTKEVGKGTGLGLSICHGIVTEHGGKIYAKSENGQGTTFVVELPVNDQ